MHGLTCLHFSFVMAWLSVSWHSHLAFSPYFFTWHFRWRFMLLPGFALSHFNMFRSHVMSIVSIVHFAFTPGRSRCAMDRAQISRLSLQELGQLIHLCLQEFGRRLGVQTDDSTLFLVNLGSLRPGEPITEAVFPAPPTPPLPAYSCVQRCSRCSSFCYDQNPNHTEHRCPAHASEESTHAQW